MLNTFHLRHRQLIVAVVEVAEEAVEVDLDQLDQGQWRIELG